MQIDTAVQFHGQLLQVVRYLRVIARSSRGRVLLTLEEELAGGVSDLPFWTYAEFLLLDSHQSSFQHRSHH
jgi:hypothetical protein